MGKEEPRGGVVLLAHAKINLTLDILGRRPDGYHELETVMQSVTLSDRVLVRPGSSGGVAVECSDPALPQGRGNLAARAAEAYFRAAGVPNPGISVRIVKRIPAAAGLGGGSADAAAVIAGLDILLGTALGTERLLAAGASVGADVPFCLTGGTMIARGVGARLAPAGKLPSCAVVIVKPLESVSTAAAYAGFDRLEAVRRPDTPAMLAALEAGDLAGVCAGLGNVFEQSERLESVTRLKDAMKRCGALGACMSGSGSAVFGIYADEAQARSAAARLRRSSGAVYVCGSAGCGWEIDHAADGTGMNE